MPPSPPVRTRAAPLSITPFYLVSDQIRYGKSIPALPQSSCAPSPSLFAGPSPGTCVCRHGRRHPSTPTMLRRCSSSTSPTPSLSRSWRSYRTSSSPAKPSPPARIRQADPPAAVGENQGHICEYFFYSKGPCAKT
jgi:hypothetical protein